MDLEQITRNSYFGKYVHKTQLGIEIGPSYRPTFSKLDGWNIVTVDHCSKSDLVLKYRAENVDEKFIANIEEVDFIWTGQSYVELFDGHPKHDYIVASHVIEHAQDLLSFLRETSELLIDGGYLLLAVPDKKATFDFFRPNTTIGDVIIGHLNSQLYDVKALLDEFHLRCELDGAIAWNREMSINSIKRGNLPHPSNNVLDVQKIIKSILKENLQDNKGYRDAHRWVFTPETLQDLIGLLGGAGLLDYQVVDWCHTGYYEFLRVLEKRIELNPIDGSRELALREFSPIFDNLIYTSAKEDVKIGLMTHLVLQSLKIARRFKSILRNLYS